MIPGNSAMSYIFAAPPLGWHSHPILGLLDVVLFLI